MLKTLQDEVPAFSGAKARAIVAQARPLPPLPARLVPTPEEGGARLHKPEGGGNLCLQIADLIGY